MVEFLWEIPIIYLGSILFAMHLLLYQNMKESRREESILMKKMGYAIVNANLHALFL